MLRSRSDQKLAELEAELRAQAVASARRSLLPFIKYTRPYFRVNWHHEVTCETIDRVVAGEIDRLILEMPPRHSKSEIGSRSLPPYWHGRNPNASIIGGSYASKLASKMNRDVQRTIDSPRYAEIFPDTKLAGENASAAGTWLRNSEEYEVVGHRGYYRSVGIGGGATGFGANLAVIDDPTKNLKDAYSIAHREGVWGWYTSTLLTREEDDLSGIGQASAIILLLTRWHEDDLAGRLLAKMAEDPEADRWHVLKFPALQDGPPTKTDPRPLGEALWPARRSAAKLKKTKASIPPAVWNALYQQKPSSPQGNIFLREWWQFWWPIGSREPAPVTVTLEDGTIFACKQKELPSTIKNFGQSWDLTFKDTKASAFVVGQAWGWEGANDYLLDQVRKRRDFNATIEIMLLWSKKWPLGEKLVEEKANGAALLNTLGSRVPGLVPINPEGSKEARAHASSFYAKSGNIWLPHPFYFPWVRDFIEELSSFPGSVLKDQVDTFSQWINNRHGSASSASLLQQLTRG